MANLSVEVVTPDGQAFAGEATSVQAPGADGSFEVLVNHAPMVSALGSGLLRVTTAERGVQSFDVQGGVLEVLNNRVIVAAERIAKA